MKVETRMQKTMKAVDAMKNREFISPEERKVNAGLAADNLEKDIGNLATFIHNENPSRN